MRHPYPNMISPDKITGIWHHKSRRRYVIDISFVDYPQNPLLVILKNPSKATRKRSDLTINRVINYINNNRNNPDISNVDKIIIVNFFVCYKTESAKLAEIVNKYGEEYLLGDDLNTFEQCGLSNSDIICKQMRDCSKIIMAWGNAPKALGKLYKKRREEILEFLKQEIQRVPGKKIFFVKSLSKFNNPKHAQGWGYKHELIECGISLKNGEHCISCK